MPVIRTRKVTWSTIAESLEEKAKPNIAQRQTPNMKNAPFNAFQVGPWYQNKRKISNWSIKWRKLILGDLKSLRTLTPGAKAPRKTAVADDTSSTDCFPSILGGLIWKLGFNSELYGWAILTPNIYEEGFSFLEDMEGKLRLRSRNLANKWLQQVDSASDLVDFDQKIRSHLQFHLNLEILADCFQRGFSNHSRRYD